MQNTNFSTIKIEFETITPIWTGDAWGENSEIKPSSIMGSLRFWFEVYCHFAGIEVKEKEELTDKEYQKILKNLKNDITEGRTIDNIDKYIFDKLPITLPSKIFGCTGWKSWIEIEGISANKRTLNKNSFNYDFLHEENNTSWWIEKVLFDKTNTIKVFENVKIKLKVNKNILNDFKKFIKFYQDKLILVGGKKAFGLGFTKLKTNLNLDGIELAIKNQNYILWDAITINKNNKKISGYNMKHYLRRKEKKNFRNINFGKMSQASNYHFSCVVNNQCHIISFNQDISILDKYKEWLSDKKEEDKIIKETTSNGKKNDALVLQNFFDLRDIK